MARQGSAALAAALSAVLAALTLGGATIDGGGDAHGGPAFSFQSATTCAGCHEAIHEEWQQSWMAGAYVNAAFQDEFSRWRTLAPTLGEDPFDCLRCHAPGALMPVSLPEREALALEGVTCEVCHRTARVEWQGDAARASLAPGFISFDRALGGPSPHPVGESAAFADSSLCAVCHQDRRGPLFIERTFREWQQGPWAAEGVGCADCHMPPAPGPSATGGTGQSHASHQFPGGHPGSPLLAGAAMLDVVSILDGVVTLAVENVGVGHNLPTGGVHPTELVLEVAILGRNGLRREVARRSYRQIFVSADGTEAGPNDAVATTIDTTLAPRERRLERVVLPVALPGDQQLEARLFYLRYARASAALKANDSFAAAMAPATLARCVASLRPEPGGRDRAAALCSVGVD